MKKFGFLLLAAALALLAIPFTAARAADAPVTVALGGQNNSGETGTATIEAVGPNDIKVTISLTPAMGAPEPAHIHKGTCANLDPTPAYPLNDVVNGKSETTLMISLDDLATGQYAINVHKSAQEIGTYVACGDIHVMAAGSSGAMAGETPTADAMGGDQAMTGETPTPDAMMGKTPTPDAMGGDHAMMGETPTPESMAGGDMGGQPDMSGSGGTSGDNMSGGNASGGTANPKPQMPTTGSGDAPYLPIGIALFGLLLAGAGLRLVRRRA